jgi:hypothetical protein
MLRVAGLVGLLGMAVLALVIGLPFVKHMNDDAVIRCSVAAPGKGLVLTKNGHYRPLGPTTLTLRWSWKRRDYLCVYHYRNGREVVRPAPNSING